jgi:cytidine deaminase
MREIEISAKIQVLSLEDIKDKSTLDIIQASKDATVLAYAPYSKFLVGCAIYLSNGEIIKGANQENASFPICICAEGVTLSTAKTMYPFEKILKLAVFVANATEPISPCGMCRQSILEYEHRQGEAIEIYLVGPSEIYHFKGIKNILPLSFDGSKL